MGHLCFYFHQRWLNILLRIILSVSSNAAPEPRRCLVILSSKYTKLGVLRNCKSVRSGLWIITKRTNWVYFILVQSSKADEQRMRTRVNYGTFQNVGEIFSPTFSFALSQVFSEILICRHRRILFSAMDRFAVRPRRVIKIFRRFDKICSLHLQG